MMLRYGVTIIIIILAYMIACTMALDTAPQQVHQGMTSDVRQRTISWVTVDTVATSVVQYGTDATRLLSSVTGNHFPFTDAGVLKRTIVIHNALISNLVPNQVYYYRVGDPTGGWSTVFQFKTFATGSPKTEIAVYGDFGVVNSRSLNMLLDEAQRRAFDMVIHVGDLAYNMDNDEGTRGDKFMQQIEPIAATMPYMACPGNHESNYNFSHFINRFSNIAQFTPSGNNWYYSWDISYVHFVSISTESYYYDGLDSNVVAQYKWLEQDLRSVDRKKTPFVIVFGHRPMYCSNVDDVPDCTLDAQRLRRGYPIAGVYYSMEDLIAKYNVDLYLTAHEHSYERTYPVYKGQIDLQPNHTHTNAKYPVHIIAGSAGCQENLDYFDDVFYGAWSVVRSASYGFAHLTIHNATNLEWRQYIDEGKGGVDQLMLIKTAEHTASQQWRSDKETPLYRGVEHAESHCDHYCYHVCSQHNVASTCVSQCHCEAEFLAGVAGSNVRSAWSKVLGRH